MNCCATRIQSIEALMLAVVERCLKAITGPRFVAGKSALLAEPVVMSALMRNVEHSTPFTKKRSRLAFLFPTVWRLVAAVVFWPTWAELVGSKMNPSFT